MSPTQARSGLQVGEMDNSSSLQAGAGVPARFAPARARAPLRRVPVAAIGLAAAAVGLWQTGSAAAVPAGVGLTALAASDFRSHRFSLRTLGISAALVSTALVAETLRQSTLERLVAEIVLVSLVALAALVLWLSTVGIAFGDVLLLSFTILVPARVSPRAVAVTVLVGLVAGGLLALSRRRQSLSDGPVSAVPLAPALLVGWVIGVVVG